MWQDSVQPIPSGTAGTGEESEPRLPNPGSGSPCPNNAHTNPSCSWEEREASSTLELGLPVYWKEEIPLLYLSFRSYSCQRMNVCVSSHCWQHPEDRGFYWPLSRNSCLPIPPRLFAVPSAAAQFSSEADVGQSKGCAWHLRIIYGFSRRPVKWSRLYIALCDCTAKM